VGNEAERHEADPWLLESLPGRESQNVEAEADRTMRRDSFDDIAHLYDENRPGYPEALFDDLIELAALTPDGRILEIGCGPGHATLPLARRGYHILAVELGTNLATIARSKLEAWPQAEVRVGTFETVPLGDAAFDLAVSASAFHWIDPAIGLPKVARELRHGGAFALWGNGRQVAESCRGFAEAVQEVYRREVPSRAGADRPRRPHGRGRILEESSLFRNVRTREYRWQQAYDAPSYLRLLSTYSDHAVMDPSTRGRLFRGIAEVVEARYGGQIILDFVTTLSIAERA
jgi:SAM-dependent methyltransferase